jgi:hypothetical protein
MSKKGMQTADDRAFWSAIQKSADLVRGAPAWTQAGIVVSDNFNGPHVSNQEADAAPRKQPA